MMAYLINKEHKDESVIRIKEVEGYKFKPKLNNQDFIKVSEVNVIDRVMLDKILSLKFDKAFKKVVKMALVVLNSEDDDEADENASVVLGEVELVREILLNRYQKFLSHEKEVLFLKKLRLIENELRLKQVKIKRKAMYLAALEENNYRRGR